MVSVIVPCRNEELYIGNFFDSIVTQDYGIENIELLIVDGISSDRTVDIIQDYRKRYNSIILLHNEKRTVPISLNLAILNAKHEIVIRMDVHCVYPKNYISVLLKYKFLDGVENVGCVLSTRSKTGSIKSESISKALSSYVGVGNSLFRTGVSKPTFVDTVPFGCFHKSIFERLGNFDTELIRNQDDEFNGRIIKNGGKILLISEISITYFPRENFSGLFRMYFQYGFYKRLVNLKLNKSMSLRQYAPPLFILFLCSIIPLILFDLNYLLNIYYLLVIVYILIILTETLRLVFTSSSFRLVFYLPLTFIILHLSYGVGYLLGNFYWLFKKNR